MKAETERASQALENMRRRSRRHLAGFQEEVGDGTMFKGVGLSRDNTDDRMFEQSKGVIISDHHLSNFWPQDSKTSVPQY